MIKIDDKKDCNGCTACVNVCPVSCIKMHTDDEGFKFAKANESICINCSLCVETCPIQSPWDKKEPLKTLASYNKEQEICLKSSSGGIFTLLAEDILEQGGVVFGACFTSDWDVEIDYIENKDELQKFRGSKYVQANVGDAFAKVEQFLKQGRKVLYTGTPCQVAGLNHCLHKKYDNLFTVDVACHGVPSPMLWKRYRNEVKERYLEGEDFTYINFRHQDNEWRGYKLKMQSENHSFAVNRGKNLYLRPFFDGLSIREACYNCSCKEGRNHSDITIADFWGLEHILPEMENPGGVCLININSDKGEQFFPYSKVHFKQASLSEAMKYNEGLHAATKRHAYRDKFFQHINSATSVIDELERMFKPTKKEKLRELYWQVRGLLSKLYHLIK